MNKLIQSFIFALAGIRYCVTTQRNMKIHVFAVLLVLGLAYFVHLSTMEFLILILTIGSVLAAEMLNTAVESIVDLMSPEYHPIAKIAKDAAAGAVLCTAIVAVIEGYFLFVVKFL